MSGEPTEIIDLKENRAMCLKPCPDGYITQTKVTGNSHLGSITVGRGRGTGTWDNQAMASTAPRANEVRMDIFGGLGGVTKKFRAKSREECGELCSERVEGHKDGACLGFRYNFYA